MNHAVRHHKPEKNNGEDLYRNQDIDTAFISIVFPNYNGGDFVRKTVDSLLHLDYPKEAFEIIIVDNASTDKSLDQIKQNYAKELKLANIKLIELPRNMGAPAAYNIGIKNAQSNYRFILKLDNDILLEKNCIRALMRPFASSLDIGITGGKVLYYSQRNRLHLIGSRISPFFAGGRGIGKYKRDNKKFDRDIKVDAVNGCMMLIKRELLEKVGLMDEDYFLYFDDIDLALRAKRAGFSQVYCSEAVAYHNTATPNKRFQSERWLYYAIYNSFYFMGKNYRGINRLIFFLALNFKVIGYFFGVLLNNKIKSYKKLFVSIFTSYKKGLGLLFRG